VLLFYKAEVRKRWTCAGVKRTDREAFLGRPSDRRDQEGVRMASEPIFDRDGKTLTVWFADRSR
jgi:hypothetical protein